jgi:hypothetical protein
MNERIKQLALECYSPYTNFDHEKFAELIVKESILTIQMGITRDGHNTEKYLRSMKHLKDIREHFGVEE